MKHALTHLYYNIYLKIINPLVFFVTILLVFTSCQNKVDLIVHNANVYTADNNFSKATSFAVDKGKFVEVGGEELLKKYNAKNIVNAQSLAIYPGFIDAHCHFLGLGLKQKQADLVGTNSFEEIIDILVAYSETKQRNVILGRGWDQNDWKEKKFPTKDRLDELFPDIPVALRRIDGHALLVNQKALDMAGIDINTEMDGGTVIKKNGKLTGVLVDTPMQLIEAILPKTTDSELIEALQAAEEICFKNGLTTVDDAGLSKDAINLIDSIQQQGLLSIRIYAMISNDKTSVDYFLERGTLKTDRLNVRSVKVYADGALGSRGAALKAPYSDLTGHYGAFITPPDSLESLAYKLAASPFQMNTHAIGDAANEAVLKAYQKALVFSEDPRWRVEHAQIIDNDDIKLFNKKIIPSVQPTHATSDMYWAEERLGDKRMEGAYAFKTLKNQSKIVALGTDFPVEQVSPFLTFYAAVARQDLEEYPETGFLPENGLSREEALLGMTRWAAHANFEETEKGSIVSGKLADFVILDRDIMDVDISLVPKTRVVATFVNGEIVYSTRFK